MKKNLIPLTNNKEEHNKSITEFHWQKKRRYYRSLNCVAFSHNSPVYTKFFYTQQCHIFFQHII